MRKSIVWALLLALVLLMTAPGAYAEGSFSMAGYDDESTGHNWSENLFFKRMEEVTHIQLELTQYKTADAWEAAKTDMLTGGKELPDALFKARLTTQETMNWYKQGKLIDLKELLPEHAPNLWAQLSDHPEWLEAITLPDGAIVALPYLDPLQFNNAMWVNKAWLRRYNQSCGLADAALEKQPATAEELEKMLRFFHENDMNGNGDDDEVALTFCSMWDLRFLQHAFGINANDYYITMDPETGDVRETLTSKANYEFLTWLNKLWAEGLLDPDGFTGARRMTTEPKEDTPLFYGVMFASTPADVVHSSKTQEYILLSPLTCDGKQVYRDLTGDVIRGAFAITSACEDPALVLQWVDYLYTDEGFVLAAVGKEGEEYQMNDDGTWLWSDTEQTLVTVTLPNATLHGDATMPGLASVDFQMRLDEKSTHHVLEQLQKLREIDSLPYPMVWLSEADQKLVDEKITAIGSYAERVMTWFVVGDVKLTEGTWNEFCTTVRELGLDDMVNIWKNAVDAAVEP